MRCDEQVALGDPDPQGTTRLDALRVPHDGTVVGLYNGVAAIQSRLRRQRNDARAGVDEIALGLVKTRPDAPPGTVPHAVDLNSPTAPQRRRVGKARSASQVLEALPLTRHGRPDDPSGPVAQVGDAGGLFVNVGYHPLAGVCRGRAAHVRDQVEQRRIRLMPDCADDRGHAGGYGEDGFA